MEPLLLTVKEAADVLGVSRSFMYNLLKAGTFPCVRVAGCVRIPVKVLQEYTENQLKPWADGRHANSA